MGSPSARTVATGGVAGEAASGAHAQLERCASPIGTVGFVEDTSARWYYTLTSTYGLPSTTVVLRMLAQQSNCFIVVDRGAGMRAMEGERALERSGELRGGSRFGPAQMVAADYAITPGIVFDDRNTSGLNGMLGNLPGNLRHLGSMAGGVRQHQAATMLTLIDGRSGVQLAMAEGSASGFDFDASTWGARLPGGTWSSLGGYTSSPQGKVIAASFTDSFNQLVRSLRGYRPQQVQGQRNGTGGTLRVN